MLWRVMLILSVLLCDVALLALYQPGNMHHVINSLGVIEYNCEAGGDLFVPMSTYHITAMSDEHYCIWNHWQQLA